MRVSQKSIIYDVLPQALHDAGYYSTGAMVVTVRDLFYSVRELYFQHPDFPKVKAMLEAKWAKKGSRKKHGAASIDFEWFREVLSDYQREYGRLDRLIWDVRGHLYEPHTSNTLEIGSLSMADYDFPEFSFDKLLYIEKEGEMNKVREARLAERFDMAILTGKGMPTEQIRLLLERAQGEDFQVFCFHDADPDGYEIARVLGEETDRMPGYSVEVIDLGLSYPDAEEMGLQGEPFTRQKRLNQTLVAYLGRLEPATWSETLAAMTGEQITQKSWSAWRYELNTIKPIAARMDYIARKLVELGVRPKVVPPDDALARLVAQNFDENVNYFVGRAINELVDKDKIVTSVTAQLRERLQLTDAETFIRHRFEEKPTEAWSAVVEAEHDKRTRGAREDIAEMVRDVIVTRVTEGDQ